jgi:hypothetical protein
MVRVLQFPKLNFCLLLNNRTYAILIICEHSPVKFSRIWRFESINILKQFICSFSDNTILIPIDFIL